MIKYNSNQPVKNSANGYKRLLCSFSPFHLFLFILFFVFCATISDLFGEFNSGDILWITMLSIILTIGQITLFYRSKVLPISEKVKHNIQKNNLPNLQEDTFSEEGITQTIYGQIYNYHYSDISSIYFFSDVIIVRKKMQFILYYARESFVNATEEEWVQFMKTQNPKIKVRRFKFDYIWYL
ncbi:hypothetical protein GIY09_09955 [Aerococcaceae bacterium WS4759]|uniref:YcxB-like protein domain-containing protein n=1 Tax=Fundicoccus ignavus TaxID=2664442 RepID=A0A6I2GE96_9LACT|nr:hypothetical protein [Fundicoccus ignavus]MRI86167.1 hypothetical protein [Fundicoccus ignavus]